MKYFKTNLNSGIKVNVELSKDEVCSILNDMFYRGGYTAPLNERFLITCDEFGHPYYRYELQELTIQQLITAAKVVIGNKRLSDTDVLETIENCLEEPFEEGDDLNYKLEQFKKNYEQWIEYHRESCNY